MYTNSCPVCTEHPEINIRLQPHSCYCKAFPPEIREPQSYSWVRPDRIPLAGGMKEKWSAEAAVSRSTVSFCFHWKVWWICRSICHFSQRPFSSSKQNSSCRKRCHALIYFHNRNTAAFETLLLILGCIAPSLFSAVRDNVGFPVSKSTNSWAWHKEKRLSRRQSHI